LTLVSAPAGYGKTTLIVQWLQSASQPAAWLSLDEDDNDPVRFLSYLVSAFQTLQPGLGRDTLAMLDTPSPAPPHAALTLLINELTTLAHELVLVLDDYHVIHAPPVHDAVSYLIEHLPPHLHVVIATRVDPPIPLNRLRVGQQVTEVRSEDLRFTPEEAAVFLNQVMGLGLSRQNIDALENRTEGWIAGLQLAALSMHGRQDVDSFIHAFTGSHRYILDYLIEEVLNHLPEELQSFLLQTSILERMCGPLCDVVLDEGRETNDETLSSSVIRHSSQGILENLEKSNLFLIPLDNERHWYRYHRLFADLLSQQLKKSRPAILPELHQRASEWYEQNDLLADAVHHALAAQDFERAASLVERTAFEVLGRNEIGTLVGWLNALPDAAIRARPWLCVLHAWMLILTGQGEAIEARLRDAESALDASGLPDAVARRVRGYISAIRAQVAFIQGAASATIEYAQDALAQLTAADHSVSATMVTILGAAQSFVGDLPAAIQSFEKAKALSLAHRNYFNAILASSALAQLAVVRGRLREAEGICRDSIQLVEGASPRAPAPSIGYAYIGLAEVLREWNDLERAAHYASDGLELCRQLGQADILRSAYVALARVQRAQGDLDTALNTLNEASQVASELSAWSVEIVAAYQARLRLAQGDLEAAAHWAQHSGLGVDGTLSFNHENSHLTLARVLIARGQHADAAKLLERLDEAAQRGGRWGSVIEIWLLQALNLTAQNEEAQALALLERVLTLAEPEGYVRIFLDEGERTGLMIDDFRLLVLV
jgi:LuxR family maltose regulon positive regulatory protein